MIYIKDFLNAIDMKITGGEEVLWKCFGPFPRMILSEDESTYSIECIFQPGREEVCEICAWDFKHDNFYRWINPHFVKARADEVKKRGLEIYDTYAYDGIPYIDIEESCDILEKVKAIVNGEEYDTSIKIPISVSKNDLFDLMNQAHKENVTLNKYVNNILIKKEFDT